MPINDRAVEGLRKMLEAIHGLQQQNAAVYGELMRMSVKISEALKSPETLKLEFAAEAPDGGRPAERGPDELDIF